MMRLKKLKHWLQSKGISVNTDLIEIRSMTALYTGESWGVFARRNIRSGDVLATIPKRAVLSVRNSQLAAFLEEERISGGLGLVVAVMHEIALGSSSEWCDTTPVGANKREFHIPRFMLGGLHHA